MQQRFVPWTRKGTLCLNQIVFAVCTVVPQSIVQSSIPSMTNSV